MAEYVVQMDCRKGNCVMRAAIYMRVGNEDQLEPETDIKDREQEFKKYCEKLKHQTAGGYIPTLQSGKDKKSR